MNLRRNILASYASQLYVTLVGIALVPLYLKHMGAEAYGLVGFFTLMQAWFAMLDLGLTPTISRETARFHGGGLSELAYRQLFRSLSVVFSCVALIGGGVLLLLSDVVASEWLNAKNLSHSEITLAVQIMSVSVALRWMGGLYRGVVTGSERFVWIGAFNALIATLRFVVVLITMWAFGFTPFVFFAHQLFVASIELLGLFVMARRLLPLTASHELKIGWSFEPVKPLLRFSLSIAFTSSIWVLVTQTDKLVLSGILPLGEYGYFSLAVLAASGIMIISSPISSAIMPRMARLHAEGRTAELVDVYRRSTRLVSAVAGSAAITIAFCSYSLLFAWSGNHELATQASPILRLYAIGNGLLAVGAFPYYLQYAKGNLRYHMIGNGLLVVFLIPSIVYAASHFGGIGAGWVWVGMNGIYLFVWLAYVHRKLAPGLHVPWILKDVLLRCLPGVLVVLAAAHFNFIIEDSRLLSLGYVVAIGLMSFLPSFFGGKVASFVRLKVISNG